jgi:hypothetical protein
VCIVVVLGCRCWECLQDWSLHGVSYFECVYKNKFVKGQKLTFTDGLMLSGDQTFLKFCVGREVEHLEAQQRIELAKTSASLANLVHLLPNTDQGLILQALAFLYESHALLRSCYIFISLYKAVFGSQQRCPVLGTRALTELNMFEYFVDSLDQVISPKSAAKRTIRSAYQISDTIKAVQKYAKNFSAALKLFEAEQIEIQKDREERDAEMKALEDQDESLYKSYKANNPIVEEE